MPPQQLSPFAAANYVLCCAVLLSPVQGSRRITFLQFVDGLRLLASGMGKETTVDDLAALVVAAHCRTSPNDQRRQQQKLEQMQQQPQPPKRKLPPRQALQQLPSNPTPLGNRRLTYS